MPSFLKVLNFLDIYERIRDKGFHFDTLEFKDGDGKTTDVYYFGSDERYGYKAFRIIQELLIDELKAMLQERGVEVRYNAKFTKSFKNLPRRLCLNSLMGQHGLLLC